MQALTHLRKLRSTEQNNSADQTFVQPLKAQCQQLKRHCHRRAAFAAAISIIPIPLLDIAVDAVVLSQQLDHIHTQLGLNPAQIQSLSPQRRQQTYTAIQAVGNHIIGRYLTKHIVFTLLARFGVRLTAVQLSKWVPILGQLLSATVNYATMRYLLNTHIDDCMAVLAVRDGVERT